MAADLSFLFGGTGTYNPGTTTAGAETVQPDWLINPVKGMIGKTEQLAGQAYTPYTGARIADLTPLQQQATQAVQAQQGSWQPAMGFAQQTAPQQVENYMSPYIGNVVNRIGQLGARNLTENVLPQLNTTFTGAGQFGSTRNADFMNRAIRDTGESVLGQQYTALNQGYQDALRAYQADAQRALQAAETGQTLGYRDIGMLSEAGKQGQNLNQQALDLAYQNFLEQRDYPKTQLQFLQEIIRGLPVSSETFTRQSTMQPTATASPLQQAAAAFTGMRGVFSQPGQPQY